MHAWGKLSCVCFSDWASLSQLTQTGPWQILSLSLSAVDNEAFLWDRTEDDITLSQTKAWRWKMFPLLEPIWGQFRHFGAALARGGSSEGETDPSPAEKSRTKGHPKRTLLNCGDFHAGLRLRMRCYEQDLPAGCFYQIKWINRIIFCRSGSTHFGFYEGKTLERPWKTDSWVVCLSAVAWLL